MMKTKTTKWIKPCKLYEEPEKVCEYVNVNDLKAYIDERAGEDGGKQPFQPCIIYNREGDGFQVVWDDVKCYAKSIGGRLELLLEFDKNRVVGIKFWGAKDRMGLHEVVKGCGSIQGSD